MSRISLKMHEFEDGLPMSFMWDITNREHNRGPRVPRLPKSKIGKKGKAGPSDDASAGPSLEFNYYVCVVFCDYFRSCVYCLP